MTRFFLLVVLGAVAVPPDAFTLRSATPQFFESNSDFGIALHGHLELVATLDSIHESSTWRTNFLAVVRFPLDFLSFLSVPRYFHNILTEELKRLLDRKRALN